MEKNCLNCKNDVGRVDFKSGNGYNYCEKNQLLISCPETHKCEMHEEKEMYKDICFNCKYFINMQGNSINPYFCNFHALAFSLGYPNLQTCKLFEKK